LFHALIKQSHSYRSTPIQSNLYCKNTADRTQQDNRQT